MSGNIGGGGSGAGTGSSGSGSSSNSNSGSGSSGSAGSSSSRARSNANAPQYMPNILTCACHAIREPGPPPPPNNAAVKGKAAWTAGATAQRQSDAIAAQSGGPMAGAQRTVAVPANQIKTGNKYPNQPPPRLPGLDMATLKQTVKNAIAARTGYKPTPEQEASDLTTELNRMLDVLEKRLSTPEGMQALESALAGLHDDPLVKIIGLDLFAARLAWSDAGLTPNADSVTQAQAERDSLAERLKNAQTEQGRIGLTKALEDAEEKLRRTLAMEKSKRDALANKNLTPSDRVAILGYTVADYKVLNPVLRGMYRDPDSPGKVKKADVAAYTELIKNALGKLPAHDGSTLGRIATAGDYDKMFDDDFSDGGFTSTSVGKPSPGGEWAITIDGATDGRDVGALSAWPKENEVLLPPGSKFVVDKDKTQRKPVGPDGKSRGGILFVTTENNVFGKPPT